LSKKDEADEEDDDATDLKEHPSIKQPNLTLKGKAKEAWDDELEA
jgi:hypothetical protein